jgi:hypothetical protein
VKVNGQVRPNEWPALTIPNSQLFHFHAEETQTFYKTLSGNKPVMLLRIADDSHSKHIFTEFPREIASLSLAQLDFPHRGWR